MNQVPVKLGPLALILAVISICLTTLAILTFTTAGADMRLAERYAGTVKERYALEKEGQEFLAEIRETVSDPMDLYLIDDLDFTENGDAVKVLRQGDATLTITLRENDEGGIDVVSWKQEKLWEEDDDTLGVWLGE